MSGLVSSAWRASKVAIGAEPAIEDVPDELKGKDDTKGEASLKGHLKNGEDEKTGSQAYVPPDAKNDKQLIAAVDLLHGVKNTATIPAAPADAAPTDASKALGAQPTPTSPLATPTPATQPDMAKPN